MSVLLPEIRNRFSTSETPFAFTGNSGSQCSSQHLAAVEKVTVCGGEIGDIPSIYSVPALLKHELIAVGSYVHKHIVPGFKYKVRVNGSKIHLFDGHSLYLENVGQGYGKRLTFESNDVLCNDNLFWSDSNETGYAFSIDVLEVGSIFSCSGASIVVTSVNDGQHILRTFTKDNHYFMEVSVNFSYKELKDEYPASMEMNGTVMLMKAKGQRRAQIVNFVATSTATGRQYNLRMINSH